MLDLTSFLIFAGASAIALAIPGPTVALVITRSLANGRRASVPLALGVGMGTLVGTTCALAGAGAVLLASATAFTFVKWIGAAYLIYLGIRLFRAEPTPPQIDRRADTSASVRGFGEGFLVTLLNPKSIIFSAAFIPQFIQPTGDYLAQAVILVLAYSVLATANGLAFALGTDVLRRFIRRMSVLQWANRIGGSLLIVSGVAGIFLKKPAT